MKADLVKAASEVIPNQHILVNMVSRRVRQLCFGYRPLVQVPPGMDAADIALTKIINEKLTFESTFSKDATDAPIVKFPSIIVAEDRGTDLLPRSGDAEKTRRGLLQFHAAPDKARFR